MTELRHADPKSLLPNPNNPRQTPASPAMDNQLLASILAVGIIQPPRVKETKAGLMIVAGGRRTAAAIRAGLPTIDVLVCDADEAADAMRSVSENLIRASMTSVDIWRATENLEALGWTEQAIADALALPARTVRRLKLLAHLHPAMLDLMAGGDMPNEDQLRTIAAAAREEQAQVWKKNKPKKGEEVRWYEIARALSKRHMPFTAAKFGGDLAKAYGVVWEDDLFAPADEDGRYTTNVEGFFGAQHEWLANNLPPRGTLLPTDEHGRYELLKKAEHVYGKPGKTDPVGHYLDPHSGEVKTIAYRMPEPKKPVRAADGASTPSGATGDDGDDSSVTKARPVITQKGTAMIGDLRTDALHQALATMPIEDDTLLGLMVLAFACDNVSVESDAEFGRAERDAIRRAISEGGALSADLDVLRRAARDMLAGVLSCRESRSQSGIAARIAGEAIGASLCLPNMATEEFLSCLSKTGVEKAATAAGVPTGVRARDTRAQLVSHFTAGTYIYPDAVFKLTSEDLEKVLTSVSCRYVAGKGWHDDRDGDGGGGDPHMGGLADDHATTGADRDRLAA